MRKTLSAFLLAIVCLPGIAFAQASRQPFDFYAHGPYRQSVPRPEAVLGYELGSRETTYWEQDRVVRSIAEAASDRVRIVPYGMTVEGRPLRIAVISAPENMARLDEIRARNARLADPRGLADADAAEITRTAPVIVWINQNVHGDESTSFESTMPLIYTLAASEDPRLVAMLRQAVVVVNPSFNPDGHERFAVYHNSLGMFDPNNDAIEHAQPWAMYGRFNHYRFDMNRDKLAQSQQEVRQEIAEYLKWNPHVYVDQHGEVDQYFFPPVALPVNMNLDVALQEKWLDIYGRGNAAAFDRHGWDYFIRKTFDFFYVGYLDSWAALNGAIGMTYETDGGGNLGFAWERTDGTVITLRDGIAHHFVAALATIETSVTHREPKLRDYLAFRRAAIEEGRTGPMKKVVLVPGTAPDRAAHLAATLRRAGVEVGVATAPFTSTAAHAYGVAPGSKGVQKRFEAGAYVVDLRQPQGRLARAFLEPEAQLNPEFVKEELDRRARNDRRGKNTQQETPGFYDVTAWSLPLAYDVEAYWLGDAGEVAVQQLAMPEAAGGERRPPYLPEGRVTGGRGTSAFIFRYDSNQGAHLALALLRDGYKVGVTPYELKAGGRRYPAGSFIVRTMRNPESLSARIATLARETGIEVGAVDSQYPDEVTTGIGSEEIAQLRPPRILVAAGDPVSQTSFGAIWFMLEREARYPFTAMDVEDIAGTDLSKFNVVVLPDGYPSLYSSRIGKEGVAKLKTWVEDGGTLVAFGGATAFLADKELKLTSARVVGTEDEDEKKATDEADEEDEEAEEDDSLEPATEPATTDAEAAGVTATRAKREKQDRGAKPDDAEDASAAKKPPVKKKPVPDTPLYVPGAIFLARVDRNYPLTYGIDRSMLPVPVNTDLFLRPSKDGANVLTFPRNVERLAGFIWPRNTAQLLGGTAYLVDEPTGKGHVVLFTEDVAFRRVWRGLDRFVYNVLLFTPNR